MATMSDVARLAGVSTATVSRVLNGTAPVDPRRARQVTAAIEKLGYRPNGVARSLRTRRSAILGLIISDIRNPFYTDMVRAVEDVAYAHGYSLVLCNASENHSRERQYLDLAVAENFSGVMLAPGATDPAELELVLSHRIPVVTVNGRLNTDSIDSVVVDNARGAETAVKHLLEQGRRRIGCIAGPVGAYTSVERLRGYRRAMRAAGIDVAPEWVQRGDFRAESGERAMRELLSAGGVDALLALNNQMTLGAWVELKRSGVAVPDDVAVIGFDGVPWAEALTPTLTTVTQPIYELGATTAKLLLDRINGSAEGVREVVLDPYLDVRQSSGDIAAPAGRGRTPGEQ